MGLLRPHMRLLTLAALVVVVALIFSFLVPGFLTGQGVVNLLRQASVLTIVALGATFVIVAGEIDLSVGSVVAFVSVATAVASKGDFGLVAIFGYAVAIGLTIGLINGFLVVNLGIPSFLATLGTLLIVRGAAMTVSLQPVAVRDLSFISFFRLKLLGVPMPALIAAAVFGVLLLAYERTRLGLWSRAVGANPEAARLAGLPVRRIRYAIMIVGAMTAALGGVVLAGRTNYGMSQSGAGLELDVIAAAVIGGARLGGGVGSIGGTVLAALLVTMIFSGIATLGLPGPYQDIVKGAMIGAAIILMRSRSS